MPVVGTGAHRLAGACTRRIAGHPLLLSLIFAGPGVLHLLLAGRFGFFTSRGCATFSGRRVRLVYHPCNPTRTLTAMSIWKRIVRIFHSRKNRDIDDIDTLRETLDSSYRRQTELLQRVRRGVADVATSRKRVELQIVQLRQQSQQFDAVARTAVAGGNDDDAREALTRKVTLDKTIEGLEEQHEGLKAEEGKLEDSAREIQTKVEEFRLRKDTLTARQTAAAARAEINSATTGISSRMGEVGQAIESAEQRTRELEAHADAVDELVAEGVITGLGSDDHSSSTFDRQFEQLSATTDVDPSSIDRELEAIKSAGGGDDGQDPVQK